MYRLNLTKVALSLIVVGIAMFALVACTNDSEDATPEVDPASQATAEELECPELVELPNQGEVPLGPPPSLPNLFTGTAYVNGEPVPEGELLYVKLTTSRSHPVTIREDGSFNNIIHGPVSDLDQGVPLTFCLGDPEGTAVRASETIEFDGNEPFKVVEVELNFPMLPSELEAQ